MNSYLLILNKLFENFRDRRDKRAEPHTLSACPVTPAYSANTTNSTKTQTHEVVITVMQ